MFLWNVEKSKRIFERVYVSSESDEVLKLAEEAGAIPIKRPDNLCGETPDIPVYQHALEHMPNCGGIVAVHADTPLVEPHIISSTRDLLYMGFQEVMTCKPMTRAGNYKGQHNKVYGSVRGLTAKRLLNYADPYRPSPEVLLVDKSPEVETLEDFEQVSWLMSQS